MAEEYYSVIVVYTITDNQIRDNFRDKLIEFGGSKLDESTYGFTKDTMQSIREKVIKLCEDLEISNTNTVSILHPVGFDRLHGMDLGNSSKSKYNFKVRRINISLKPEKQKGNRMEISNKTFKTDN